jgi:hypothetical protein
MASQTSESMTQTHSFIFTSSRQCTNLRDKNVIGVVAAGGRASTNNVFPNTLPASSSTTSDAADGPAVLTPEQIRVHALGAKHAIPAHSPFVQLARNRSTSTVLGLPLQSPFSPPDEEPLDRGSHRKGIDFYIGAARVAKTRPSMGSLSQPVTPNTKHFTPPSPSPSGQAAPNTLMTSLKQPPNMRRASLEALPCLVETPVLFTPPASPTIDENRSKRKTRSRSKTLKERARPERKHERPSFPGVRYTKYLVRTSWALIPGTHDAVVGERS